MGALSQFQRVVAVTASDTVDLPGGVADGLIATGTGTVTVQLEHDTTSVAFSMPTANVPLTGLRIRRVLTTAVPSGMKALYYR